MNDKQEVCYFLKSHLPTAPGNTDGKKVVILKLTGCIGLVVRKNLISQDQLISKSQL